MTLAKKRPTIGIVGPCGSGKTTLTCGLEQHHISVRHIAQEHSYVPEMWKRISNPIFLIYLNVSFENSTKRRKLDWTLREFEEQIHRLEHAYEHADLIIETDLMNSNEVLNSVLQFIYLKSKSSP
jgi:shikimate kinase